MVSNMPERIQPDPAKHAQTDGMVSWDIAERTIDSTSPACRGSLQDALEQPTARLSPTCRAEVARILERQTRQGDGKVRRNAKSGVQDEEVANATPDSGKGPKIEKINDGTHPATIVLTFVSCVLVAFAATAYYVSGGRSGNGRNSIRGEKMYKKKHDRIRERGKRRR